MSTSATSRQHGGRIEYTAKIASGLTCLMIWDEAEITIEWSTGCQPHLHGKALRRLKAERLRFLERVATSTGKHITLIDPTEPIPDEAVRQIAPTAAGHA